MLSMQHEPIYPLPTDEQPIDLFIAPLNSDALPDMAVLSATGKLTTAQNKGDNTWTNVKTVDLGIGPACSLIGGNFTGDQIADLVVQGPDGVYVFKGDGDNGYSLLQTISATTAGMLAPGSGRIRASAAMLDGDGKLDLATVSPGSDEIWVLQGTGNGFKAAPRQFSSGGDEPIAVVSGNFLGDGAPDLAVGHRDGTVTFLEGDGKGNFALRPSASVAGLGPVRDLQSTDWDGDGDLDLFVSSDNEVRILVHTNDPLAENPLVNGDFSAGLTGWTSEVVGTSANGLAGTVSGLGGMAQLRENESFLTSLAQEFVVPPTPQTISFDLAGLSLENPQGGIPDAFEVSLLDANMNSLIPTIGPNATSFFNVNPGGQYSLAPGVTRNGTHITVNISGLTPGTHAKLFFDLIGNKPGTGSTASIDNVQIEPHAIYADNFTAAPLAGPFDAPAGMTVGDFNGDGYADLVVADSGSNKLILFEGNGRGQAVRSEFGLSSFGNGALAVAGGKLTAGDSSDDAVVALFGSAMVMTPLYTLIDNTPPEATLVSPEPGTVVLNDLSQIKLRFNEAVVDSGPAGQHSVTNPAAYQLVNVGPNGIYDGGTGDDVIVPLASVSYDSAAFEAVLAVDPVALPLLGGQYRLAIQGDDPLWSIEDLAGNRLGGGLDVGMAFTVNRAPVVLTPQNIQGFEGEEASLNVSFTDPGFLDAHTALIDWGDGTIEPATVVETNGNGTVTGIHIYADNGNYTFRVTVQDAAGNSSFAVGTALIGNMAPTVSGQNQSAVEGLPQSFSASFQDHGFTNILAGTHESFSASIDWGDGSPLDPVEVLVTNGQAGVPTAGTVSGGHTYRNNGSYTGIVTVTDDDGGTGLATFTITVENALPTVLSLSSVAGNEGGEVQLSGTFSDPGIADTHTALVHWGDGSTSAGLVAETDGQGTVAATHIYADNGNYNVWLEVIDNAGGIGERAGTATIANVAPTATTLVGPEVIAGSPVNISVATFVDPGYTNAAAGTQETFSAEIDWGDGSGAQPGTITVQQGEAGRATQGVVSGTHTYQNAGTYTVLVTVHDDDGGVDIAELSVVVLEGQSNGLRIVDFDKNAQGNSLSSGTVITDQWAAWGMHVTTNNPTTNPARIFDSSLPMCGYWDLVTPNILFGGLGIGSGGMPGAVGENRMSLGNVLVVGSENMCGWHPANSGTLVFTFDNPVTLREIHLLDIDLGCNEGLSATYWKQSQNLSKWKGFSPEDNFNQVFGVNDNPSLTLLGALSRTGCGCNALASQAVAALLNDAESTINYRYDYASIMADVQSAYATNCFDPAKNRLATENNRGLDSNNESGGAIVMYDAAGAIVAVREITPLGSNSFQSVALNAAGVSRMEVRFVGTGAVGELIFARPNDAGARGFQPGSIRWTLRRIPCSITASRALCREVSALPECPSRGG